MTRILLIRHALTDEAGKIFSGRKPGLSLNSEGRSQVDLLTERLSKTNLAAVYSSPVDRAVETAGPVAASHNLDVTISEDFNELDFGNWTGLSIEQLKDDPAFRSFNTLRSLNRIPGGELMVEAQLRIIKGIEKLRVLYPGGSVAVVSHADMIRAAIAFFSGIHIDLLHKIEISTTSISIIETGNAHVRIISVNSLPETFISF